MIRAEAPARVETREQANSWSLPEDARLIATWRRGAAAASRMVSEVSKSLGKPPRNVRACHSRVATLRARGHVIVATSDTVRAGLVREAISHSTSPTQVYRPGNDPAAREAAAAKVKRRKCLRCRDLFDSEGSSNHICPDCKKDHNWRDGEDSDFSLSFDNERL